MIIHTNYNILINITFIICYNLQIDSLKSYTHWWICIHVIFLLHSGQHSKNSKHFQNLKHIHEMTSITVYSYWKNLARICIFLNISWHEMTLRSSKTKKKEVQGSESVSGRGKKMERLYLFAHTFDFIGLRRKARSSSVRGTVHWVGLSAPVVALSWVCTIYLLWLVCPSCWRSAVSILLWSPT